MRIPFKASKSAGFELIPDGTYQLRITGVTEKTSKSSNLPMLEVDHVIESDDQYNGRKFKRWFMLEGKGSFRLYGLLEACIPDKIEINEAVEKDDEDRTLDGIEFDTDDLIDAVYLADCYTRKGEGQYGDSNDWKKERPVNPVAEDEESEEQDDESVEASDEEEEEQEEEAPAEPPKKAAAPAKKEEKKAAPATNNGGNKAPSNGANGNKAPSNGGKTSQPQNKAPVRERTRLQG